MKNEYMIITYWDTLYNKTSTYRTCSQITFSDDGIHFSSGGHRYCIPFENILKIESISD